MRWPLPHHLIHISLCSRAFPPSLGSAKLLPDSRPLSWVPLCSLYKSYLPQVIQMPPLTLSEAATPPSRRAHPPQPYHTFFAAPTTQDISPRLFVFMLVCALLEYQLPVCRDFVLSPQPLNPFPGHTGAHTSLSHTCRIKF